MKTINIYEDSQQVIALLEQAREEDLVLQLVDGSQFVLSAAKKANEYEVEMAQEQASGQLKAVLDERAKEPQK
ncbi:hypothetical protein [Merismopedia glauca]|uniref:Uncharacterized protein n=1 Tax=Merismopedia glauca CCAP 1448/3 TaxID=1296344 RepID=A0A2T1C3M8_9CYAN|nr:hypothetical protein [Merismopedia glauca]PSB02859.1 hypothetical protein C7B64_11230 [Merismopedia glauca CCAP 1448/3]